MRQRAMIALSLLHEPELVIADEPTTALDVLVQDQILGEIDALRERMGLSLILISHDMGAVAETCSRVAVMYAGEIVELAPTETIFENAHHPYTQALLEALPTVAGPRRPLRSIPGEAASPMEGDVGCRFAARCHKVQEICRTSRPAPARSSPGARGAVPLPRTGHAVMNAPLLALTSVTKHYPIRAGWLDTLRGRAPAALRAVDSIDLRIEAGEIVGLVGESGSGKTTTGKLITLQERPTGGSLLTKGPKSRTCKALR